MNKSLMILSIVVIVAAISVSGCISFNGTKNHEDTILELNESGNLEEVKSLDEYNKKLKKNNTKVNADGLLSADEVKKSYTEIFKKIYGVDNVTSQIFGPYQFTNGTYYYTLAIDVVGDTFIDRFILDVDAKILPTDGKGKNTIYYMSIFHLDKSDNITPKLSHEDIIIKAKEVYATHRNASDSDSYDITGGVGDDKVPVYIVNVNHGDALMLFNANTGELLYDSLEGVTLQKALTEDECRSIAQQELDKRDYSYSSNLSLGSANKMDSNGTIFYSFDIEYSHDDQKEVIGSITVNANNSTVSDFTITEPEINNDTANNTTSTDYEDDPSYYEEDPYYEDEPYVDYRDYDYPSSGSENSSSYDY